MNTKVWYLPNFKDVYHTRMIETFSNANARMVHMVHTMFKRVYKLGIFKMVLEA